MNGALNNMDETKILSLLKDGWKFHYAPASGDLCLTKDREVMSAKNWSEFHEMMGVFLNFKRAEIIILKEEITYGHFLFHGHKGLVLIYELKD